MCKLEHPSNEYSKTPSSPPSAVQADSNLSEYDETESVEINESYSRDNSISNSNGNSNSNSNSISNSNSNSKIGKSTKNEMNSKDASPSSSVLSGMLQGVVFSVASLEFPFIVSGRDLGSKIYQKASYDYDPAISLFDNTIWTYGTDYALAAITTGFAIWILQTSNRSSRDVHKRLARVSATMLILYSVSTGAGAIAHQYFLTVESRNSMVFRLLWTICVGTVYLAAIPMGIIGCECLRIFQPRPNCPPLLKTIPLVTNTHWVFYGAIGTIACALGFMSFQRPACDIFIAGCTQSPSTFYCIAFLISVEHPLITKFMKLYGALGFISNAILLPLYPTLVLNFSLATTNTILHTNLCIAWSLQGLVLQRVVKGLVEETHNEQRQEQLRNKKVL